MEVTVVGDCHGQKPDIEDDPDAILAVGDICGDNDEIRDLMFESDDPWYESVGKEEAKEYIEQSLEEGREVLEHLDSFGVPVYVIPGNWDWTGRIYDWDYLSENRFQELVEKFDNVRNVNFNKHDLAGFVVIGYGPCPAPELPQYKENVTEEADEVLMDYRENRMRLNQLFEQAEKPVIFLTHNGPFDSSIDRVQEEDEVKHYGSVLVREMVQRHRPVFTASGHIHDARGKHEIGDIPCVNPGLQSNARIVMEDFEPEEISFDPEL